MNCTRTLTLPPHLQAAKIAFVELVDAFGGQEAAARETGKSQSRISAYGHRNMADMPPLDVVDTLEARTVGEDGHPHVTRWRARRLGYELVKLPDASASPPALSAMVSDLVKSSGRLGGGLIDDLTGGKAFGAAEAWRRLADADDLVRIAVQLRHELQLRAAEEG